MISKKVCLLGNFAAGKTSLVRRFVYNRFDDRYMSTIGVKVSRKMITLPHEGELVELSILLWDLAGSEEFDALRASYLRGASGAVLVCDLTRPETLDPLRVYAEELLRTNTHARLILAANKCDLVDQRRLSPAQIAVAAAALDVPYYLTSARSGEEVENLFRHLGRLLLS